VNTPRFYFLLAVACSLILFFAVSVPSAHAGVWDQATKVTFSAPVEVPGMVLPAGTYWFSLLNDDSDRNICVIWNTNRTRVMASIPRASPSSVLRSAPVHSPRQLKRGFIRVIATGTSSCTRNRAQPRSQPGSDALFSRCRMKWATT